VTTQIGLFGGDVSGNGADVSPCSRYCFRLWRSWEPALGSVTFVMLNPSTADAHQDDPTSRKCIGFARAWGLGGIEVVNLFAWRATDPRDVVRALWRRDDVVGPGNDDAILAAAQRARIVVAAWGALDQARDRAEEVLRLLGGAGILVHHLGLSKDGAPRHPLYLRADTPPALLGDSGGAR
jgi:hypothetical protein